MGTCKNCQRYRPSKAAADVERYGALSGRCLSSFIAQGDDSTDAEPMIHGAVYVGIGGSSDFVTGPDFGCINHVAIQ